MNRFFGMMPTSEIKRMQSFSVGFDRATVTIQAGENGWTILYADHSSKYSDQVDTTDNNFDKAMEVLKLNFDNINPVAVRVEKMEDRMAREEYGEKSEVCVDALSFDELSEEKEIEERVESDGEMWDKIEGEDEER